MQLFQTANISFHNRVEEDAADADGATEQLHRVERLTEDELRARRRMKAGRGLVGTRRERERAGAWGGIGRAVTAEPTRTMTRLAVLATDAVTAPVFLIVIVASSLYR